MGVTDTHQGDVRLYQSPLGFGVSTRQSARLCGDSSEIGSGTLRGIAGIGRAPLSPMAAADATPEVGGVGEAIAAGTFCSSVVHAVESPAGSVASLRLAEGLTDSERRYVGDVLGHEVTRNTMRNYRAQWGRFTSWALDKGIPALPADPVHVAAYLAERVEGQGHKPATLRTAASAIAFMHRTAGLGNPCAEPAVRRILRSAVRKIGRVQKQADALTAEAFAVIASSACNPRRGRGGLESPEAARHRGNTDIALISLMRDAMLRVSEAADLIWTDITFESDGTGRLLIRRSKTDAEGEGAVAFLSVPTMAALDLIREGAFEASSVFGLRPNQIAARIKKAASAAGLGDRFSGHSPRVGMTRDLARAGIELPSLMHAGRWRSPGMPAHYIRNETAGRGAVAQFYGFACRPA